MESEKKKAINLRNKMKMNRPRIIRQESWRYKRIKSSWRRPPGVTSCMRLQRRGWPRLNSASFGIPKILRNIHPSGLREILVHRPEDLEGADPKKQAVRIAACVGERKRMIIIEKADTMDLKILNPRLMEEKEEIPETGESITEEEDIEKEKEKTKK
ncbi:MAG: 50S ribosomal protein L32e [Candidatus Bathyarchaeota archaeon]|nr:50S ribosomal protein L32e [Candidatus Bathyarchaeota archaeon]